jgi:hypothetical protein
LRLTLDVRDLIIATWPVEGDVVAGVLPPGIDPAEIDGAHRLSIVALRYTGGRLGRVPVPRFSQLNVRTYVEWEGGPAVFFLATRVSAQGLGGVALGAPYRYAVLRFRPGSVRAPGLGVSLSYRAVGGTDPGPLGHHELGLFEHDGLRAVRIVRGGADWQAAELTEEPRTDILVAYGFSGLGPPDLVYAPRTSFEVDVPPEKISSTRARR